VVEPLASTYANGERCSKAEIALDIEESDLKVIWDERAVRLILERLLNNAIEHTEEPHRIRLGVRRCDEETLVLSVTDQGSGISEQISGRVFMPFFPQHRGRPGLGLAVARKYATLLGGRLEIRSVPGQGTEARCTIPVSVLVR
jgi:signal transduction histidine kinase